MRHTKSKTCICTPELDKKSWLRIISKSIHSFSSTNLVFYPIHFNNNNLHFFLYIFKFTHLSSDLICCFFTLNAKVNQIMDLCEDRVILQSTMHPSFSLRDQASIVSSVVSIAWSCVGIWRSSEPQYFPSSSTTWYLTFCRGIAYEITPAYSYGAA